MTEHKTQANKKFSDKHRLKHSKLFAETFAQNRRWVGRYMVLWRRSEADASLRLGVITSKKLHLRANKRNRARRLLREVYRNCRPYLSGQFDILLIGRRAILKASYKEIIEEFLTLSMRAKLISDKNKRMAEEKHGISK